MKLKLTLLIFLSLLLTGCSFLTQPSKLNEEEWKTALNYETYENSTMHVLVEDIFTFQIEIKFLPSKMFFSHKEGQKDAETTFEEEGLVDLTDYRIFRIYFSATKNVADSKYLSKSTMFNGPEDVTYEFMLKVVGNEFLNLIILKDYYDIAVYKNNQYIIDGSLIGKVTIGNQETDYSDLLIKYTFKDKKLESINVTNKIDEKFKINVNFSNIGITTLNYDTSAICTHQFSLEHGFLKNSEDHKGVCLLCSELNKNGDYIYVSDAHVFENGICAICGFEITN